MTTKLMAGKRGLIMGVANDHSIAWAISKEIMAEGGQIGFSHLPDRADDERQRNRRRVALLTDPEPNAKFLVPMDAGSDEQIAHVAQRSHALVARRHACLSRLMNYLRRCGPVAGRAGSPGAGGFP